VGANVGFCTRLPSHACQVKEANYPWVSPEPRVSQYTLCNLWTVYRLPGFVYICMRTDAPDAQGLSWALRVMRQLDLSLLAGSVVSRLLRWTLLQPIVGDHRKVHNLQGLYKAMICLACAPMLQLPIVQLYAVETECLAKHCSIFRLPGGPPLKSRSIFPFPRLIKNRCMCLYRYSAFFS